MTWVIGSPTLFGYAIALADIQVTIEYSDGTKKYFDAIQKLFPVGKFVTAGFSGSVEVGYYLIDDLRKWACIPEKGVAWIPDCLVAEWHRRARYLFSKLPKEKQRYTELLLVSVYPIKNNGIPGEPQTYSCIMRSPMFVPEPALAGKIVSIGSGNNVEEYKNTIEQLNTGYNPLMQMEVNSPGGYGQAISINVSINVWNHPVDGISPHFHISEVRRGKIILGANDHKRYEADGSEVVVRMPPVATNWLEFQQTMLQRGISMADVKADA